MFPTKILLATDGSGEAAHAARVALELSEKLHSELHLTYVEPVSDPQAWPEVAILDIDMREKVRERAGETARAKLDAEWSRYGGRSGKISGTHARVGRADAEIVALAEEIEAGLIVVGSRGLGPIRRAVIGSISSSVVRHAHGPVLVVRSEGGTSEEGIGPIILAVDGSRESRLAATAAAEVSAGTGYPMHIAYVMPDKSRLYGRHLYSGEMKKSVFRETKAAARRLLDELADEVRAVGGVVAQSYLCSGRPDEEIVELAEEIEAGLIVVGSRGLGGVQRALMGSVSDSVVRHAHCPVLVVRSAQAGDGGDAMTQVAGREASR